MSSKPWRLTSRVHRSSLCKCSEAPKRTIVILGKMALTAGFAALLAGHAQAAIGDGALGLRMQAAQIAAVEKVQFVYGGKQYRWYSNGWNGPGYYQRGDAWNNGVGWGGGYGWNGWGGGNSAGGSGYRAGPGGFGNSALVGSSGPAPGGSGNSTAQGGNNGSTLSGSHPGFRKATNFHPSPGASNGQTFNGGGGSFHGGGMHFFRH